MSNWTELHVSERWMASLVLSGRRQFKIQKRGFALLMDVVSVLVTRDPGSEITDIAKTTLSCCHPVPS